MLFHFIRRCFTRKWSFIFFNRRLASLCSTRWFIDHRSKPASSKLVAEKLLHQLNTKSKMLNFELYNPTNLVFERQIEKLEILYQKELRYY
jgi:hypothetical protein